MAKYGKKYLKAREDVDTNSVYSLDEGISKVKDSAFARFDESVDAHISLGIDPTKGDQVVRGSVVLPHGTGKKSVIVAFAKGDAAKKAEEAGADVVGAEELVQKIQDGWLDFTVAVATPDMMGIVGKVAKILGPRGLLPNKKTGTVTVDVSEVISDLKKGKVFFKNDKSGIVHLSFGRVSFDQEKLKENFTSFMKALSGSKPPAAKGKFIKKATITSTMGVGIKVNPEEL
jgi:large subunit ribosomal protein L1